MKDETPTFIVLAVLLALLAVVTAVLLLPRIVGPPGSRITPTRPLITSGISAALNLYKLHVGEYPVSLDELVARPQSGPGATKWLGPYVRDARALRDAWGNALLYQAPGRHNPKTYDLWSAGPDGQSGTADDISNWLAPAAPATAPAGKQLSPTSVPSADRARPP